MKFLIIIAIIFAVTGCSMNQTMVHPQTRDKQICSNTYWPLGLLGLGWYGVAKYNNNQCIKKFKGMGYIEAERFDFKEIK